MKSSKDPDTKNYAAAQAERRRQLEEYKMKKELAKQQQKLHSSTSSTPIRNTRSQPTAFSTPYKFTSRSKSPPILKQSDFDPEPVVDFTSPQQRLTRQLSEWQLRNNLTTGKSVSLRNDSRVQGDRHSALATPLRATTADLRKKVAESARKIKMQSSLPTKGAHIQMELEMLQARIDSASKLSRAFTSSTDILPISWSSLSTETQSPQTVIQIPEIKIDKNLYKRHTLQPPPRPVFITSYKIPQRMYLQVVDPKTDEIISEEAVPYAHVPLYRLENIINASKMYPAQFVKHLFTIIGAPCPSRHRQCISIYHQASYWITRAKVEEDLNNYEEVVRLYEEAVTWEAEPVAELKKGLMAFLRQRVDDSPMFAALHAKYFSGTTISELDDSSSEDTPSLPDVSLLKITSSDDEDEINPPKLSFNSASYSEDHYSNETPLSGDDGESADKVDIKSFCKIKNNSHADEVINRQTTENNDHGRITVLTPVRAKKQVKKNYKVESVVTPVRRSTRHIFDVEDHLDDGEKKIADLLEENGFLYISNPRVKLSKSRVSSSTPAREKIVLKEIVNDSTHASNTTDSSDVVPTQLSQKPSDITHDETASTSTRKSARFTSKAF